MRTQNSCVIWSARGPKKLGYQDLVSRTFGWALLFFALVGAPLAWAQDGSKSYTAGQKAFTEGKLDRAVELLTKAIKSDELSSKERALALYRRGLAQQQKKNIGAALADFNGAIFIKSLPAAERAAALKARADVLASLGQTQKAAVDRNKAKALTPVDQSSEKKSAARSAQGSGQTTGTVSQANKRTASNQGFKTTTTINAGEIKDSKPTSSQPQPLAGITNFFQNLVNPNAANKPSAAKSNSAGQSASRPNTQVSRPPQTAAKKPVQTSQSIGNGWSSATRVETSKGAVKPTKPVQVARQETTRNTPEKTVAAPRKQAAQKPKPQIKPAAKPQESKPVRVAAVKPQKVAIPVPRKPSTAGNRNLQPVEKVPSRSIQPEPIKQTDSGGRYRLKLASLSDVNEAIATWKKLSSLHKDLLRGRNGEIQQIETPGKGTIYTIRIGPFVSQAQSMELCNEFRRRGVGCALSE